MAEINRLNNRHWNYNDNSVIISSNLKLKVDGTPYSQQGEPADSGIAVYFTLVVWRGQKKIERPIVMSCDKWRKTSDNLYAIGKDIEAQRARERWGCTNYEQSFRGYLAIPEKCGGASWWELLGVPSNASKEIIRDRYLVLVKKHHPDVGGNPENWNRLSAAYDQAMALF